MVNLNWRSLEFILNAAAQNTETCCDQEVLFLIGLVMEQQQNRQLDAAILERFKLMIADYEAALLDQETLPLLTP